MYRANTLTTRRRALSFAFIPMLLCGLAARTDRVCAAEKTITVHSSKYAFVPAAVTLRKGESTKIVLVTDDIPHGLAVPELDLHVDATENHPGSAEVTPEAAGEFEGKCSKFCGLGHKKMHFLIRVTE